MSLFYSVCVVLVCDVTELWGQQPLESVMKYSLKEFNEQVPTKNHFVLFFVPWYAYIYFKYLLFQTYPHLWGWLHLHFNFGMFKEWGIEIRFSHFRGVGAEI